MMKNDNYIESPPILNNRLEGSLFKDEFVNNNHCSTTPLIHFKIRKVFSRIKYYYSVCYALV